VSLVEYVLIGHFRLALVAGILFAAGLLASVPVARYRLSALEWLPLRLMRLVMRLMGRAPALARMAIVIWLFNSSAMFVYMASGFLAAFPMIFAFWTGLNIGLMVAHAGGDGAPLFAEFARPDAGQWLPSKQLTAVCGAAVLLLELPCFFYALGMGMGLATHVQQAGARYAVALTPRASAYVCIIVPALLVSAVAESIAIRGAAGSARRGGS